MRIAEAELRRYDGYLAVGWLRDDSPIGESDLKSLIAEVRRLQGLLLGLADASGKVLGQELAAIAQAKGVEVAQRLALVIAEVEAIRKEQIGEKE